MDGASGSERFETVIIGGGQAGLSVGTTWPGEIGGS
jgi:cation diffusion facilitator CzcD-associated flavoprotein CzcO